MLPLGYDIVTVLVFLEVSKDISIFIFRFETLYTFRMFHATKQRPTSANQQFMFFNYRHIIVPNVKKIQGFNLTGTPWATSSCCGMTFTFTFNCRQSSSTCIYVQDHFIYQRCKEAHYLVLQITSCLRTVIYLRVTTVLRAETCRQLR